MVEANEEEGATNGVVAPPVAVMGVVAELKGEIVGNGEAAGAVAAADEEISGFNVLGAVLPMPIGGVAVGAVTVGAVTVFEFELVIAEFAAEGVPVAALKDKGLDTVLTFAAVEEGTTGEAPLAAILTLLTGFNCTCVVAGFFNGTGTGGIVSGG
jgi:hypothetical protein